MLTNFHAPNRNSKKKKSVGQRWHEILRIIICNKGIWSLLWSLRKSISVAISIKFGFGAFHHLYFPQKYTELAVRENKTKATLWRLSSGVISILLTRRQHPCRAVSPSPVPAEPLAQDRDFRFQGCRGPAKGILFHVLTNPSRVAPGRGKGVPWVTRGRVRPPRSARTELAGSRLAASSAEWVATPARPGPSAEVHSARPATLKPVPRTAPWRRWRRLRHHDGVSADVLTLPGVLARYWLSLQLWEPRWQPAEPPDRRRESRPTCVCRWRRPAFSSFLRKPSKYKPR